MTRIEVRNLPILVLVLFINATHESRCRRKDLIDKDEDGLLGRELDPLANDVDKLADGQVRRHKILLLIDGRDVALLDLLADDLRVQIVSDKSATAGENRERGSG